MTSGSESLNMVVSAPVFYTLHLIISHNESSYKITFPVNSLKNNGFSKAHLWLQKCEQSIIFWCSANENHYLFKLTKQSQYQSPPQSDSHVLANSPITFSYARTAFLTQSSHGQSTFPVSIPLRSLHLTAPQLFLNSSTICLVYMRVLEPSVLRPAIMPAPTRAPQVASMAPMPTQKPVEIILSWSFGISVSSANAAVTAWQQL